MTPPVTRREFFALEAGEYLERLALLATGTAAPDAEGLVRYARALRGSALLAGPPGYAVAAAAIENVAKALRDGSALWSVGLAELLREAVETGKYLLRRIREWSAEDVALCERTAEQLNGRIGLAGNQPAPGARHNPATQSSAVRAYVARETAALAAALEQAAAAVERSGGDRLLQVGERLQPLRGLGSLPGLSPLPELLEAVELTLALGQQSGAWPPHGAQAFRATATALGRLARDIAGQGLPNGGAPELEQAVALLRSSFAGEADVVPVESLFAAGDLQPVLRRGQPRLPSSPTADPAVELMSLADRLRAAAAQLKEASSAAVRLLVLYSLGCSLRAFAPAAELRARAGSFLAELERAAFEGDSQLTAQLPLLLEQAATAFAAAAESGSLIALESSLANLSEALAGDIVPIASLAPDPDVVPIESLAPEPFSAFEQSFTTYHRLLQDDAVPIESLVYRGRRALERADLVRRELDAALREQKQLAELRGLLRELLDLVPLALDDQR